MSLIDAHRARFGVEPSCRTLGLAPSSSFPRTTRPPSRRQVEDGRRLARIRSVHEHNDSAYGSRRVWTALRRHGVPVPRCRVERLMRQHGLRGAQGGRKRRWPGPTIRRRVKDVVSRMIVGWQTPRTSEPTWSLDALEMAVHLRRPAAGARVHHTDRGSQTRFRSTQRLADLGIAASVGSVADADDYAMAESFVGTLNTELVRGRAFATRFEAEIAVVEYLGWFNHTRLHQSLGDLPPSEFEALSPPQNETITSTMISKETN